MSSLKASDKGSYYRQEEFYSNSDTIILHGQTSSLDYKESVSFLKLSSSLQQSFVDEYHDEESDQEMHITWESNIDDISDKADSESSSDDEEDEDNNISGRVLMHLGNLQKHIYEAAVCSYCKTGQVYLEHASGYNKRGLCLKLALTCSECNKVTRFDTDERGEYTIHNVNRLSVLAMRMIGKSRSTL